MTTDTLAAQPPRAAGKPLSQWVFWGRAMVLPYVLVFLVFVLFPVCYGLWLARHPASYQKLFDDPIFFRTAINTLVFIVVAINLKMIVALGLSGFFVQKRWWISVLAAIFIIPWAVPSIPTILSVRFMLNPEWGVINTLIFKLTARDGPNWLNDPTLALAFSMLMHIWKSLPFWTLILVAGRLAIPGEQYEAASVDGAGRWAQFRRVTVPMLRPTTGFVALMTLIGNFQLFAEPYIMTRGGPSNRTLSVVLYMYEQGFRWWNLGYAAALAFVLFAIVLLVSRLARRREAAA